MKRDSRIRLAALVISVATAVRAPAKLPPPYDFTGSWTGGGMTRGVTYTITAAFTATSNPRKFTGSSAFSDDRGDHSTCTFTAVYKKTLKLHLSCDDGHKQTIGARFDGGTQTLAGSFLAGHRHPVRAPFTLRRVT